MSARSRKIAGLSNPFRYLSIRAVGRAVRCSISGNFEEPRYGNYQS